MWNLVGHAVTPGFDMNDVGFQRNADWILATGQVAYLHHQAGRLLQYWWIGTDQIGLGWDFGGERRAGVVGLHGGLQTNGRWTVEGVVDRELASVAPEALRGGPSLLMPPRTSWWTTGSSDWRRPWQLSWAASGFSEPATGSRDLALAATLAARASDRLSLSLGPALERGRDAWRYVTTATALGAPRYILGDSRQTSVSWTVRGDYGFSAHLTLQLYAQPFIAAAAYDGFGEVVAPRAAAVADRVRPVAATYDGTSHRFRVDLNGDGVPDLSFADPAFSRKDLNLNVVLRWEFRPGSALYVVWTQQRNGTLVDGSFRLGRDLGRLFREPAANVLLVKASYWWAP